MSLHYLLMSNHLLVQKAFLQRLGDTTLSLGQPKVLDYLQNHDGSIQKEIADNCHIEPASLSSILNGMEKNDIIVRKTDPQNRRQTLVFLSEKGKTLIPKINDSFQSIERQALDGLSAEEIKELYRLLEKTYENLKEMMP